MHNTLHSHTETTIVGVLNVTPDSFSDGGRFVGKNTESLDIRSAIESAKTLLLDGAHIIEIGGESTGPGTSHVPLDIEMNRVIPIIRALLDNSSDTNSFNTYTICVDTYKAQIAQNALQLGASIINDVSAMRADVNMASVIKDFNAKVVLMYSKEDDKHPHVSNTEINYDNAEHKNITTHIIDFLSKRISYALSKNIPEQNIILDPGMGRFLGSNANLSWAVIHSLDKIVSLGFPVMIGTSRKSFLGGATNEREIPSAITSLYASLKGCNYIRTHNPKLTKQALTAWAKCDLGRDTVTFR